MSCPDEYWAQVGKATEAKRNVAAMQSATVKMGWIRQATAMGKLSRNKYAGRVRSDGKVLCLKCKKYRNPDLFWVISGGTYLNFCKTCSSGRKKQGGLKRRGGSL